MSEKVEISMGVGELQNACICGILILLRRRNDTGVSPELRKLKLLISDASEEFRLALADRLKNEYVIRMCGEGNETLVLLRTFRPDVMVLDLTLPGLDGITLLQRAGEEGVHPVILATTRFFNDYVQRSIEVLGVGYVMLKPCEIAATVARLTDLAESADRPAITHPEPRVIVTNALLAMGFEAKLRGFGCLVEAVLVKMQDPSQQITKELYPAVVHICGGNSQQVERAIRSAIEKAWIHGDGAVWRQCFQPDGQGKLRKPSNGTFISSLATRIKMDRESGEQSDFYDK